MKIFFALGGLLLALNGYSQSYLVLNNGVTLTTDKDAFVYDFGNFILPYKVTVTGGQFFSEDDKFISVDEQGFLYRKDEKLPKKVKGKGANYLISDNDTLYTFDAKGFLFKFDKDSAFKRALNFGGNFFTVKPEDKKDAIGLYTINALGNYTKLNIPGLIPAEIATFGGNYFVTTKNVVYTVSKDGFVFSKAEVKVGIVKKMGGNFFIDSNNLIYTVSSEGLLVAPSLPTTLKLDTVTKLGSNYFIDQEGKFFGVDKQGNIYEREIKNHDIKNVKILSL